MVQIAAVKYYSHGPLAEMLEAEPPPLGTGPMVICCQEHRVLCDRLGSFQAMLSAAGYHWVRSVAEATETRGSRGGVAVLRPTNVQVTCPRLLMTGTLAPARAVAVHIHSKMKG
eukprot:207360-Pyramimonas_sp.AAC.1